MKFYRLSESDNRYGIAGRVIPYNQWLNIPYYDRKLFDMIDEAGSEYLYKLAVSKRGATPSLYYLEDYPSVVVFLSIVYIQSKSTENSPVVAPKTDAIVNLGIFTITITYRKEWDTKSTV